MTRHDAVSRFSSLTSSSTDSTQSTGTVKPSSRSNSSITRRGPPARLKTDANGIRRASQDDNQVSPTSIAANHRGSLSPSISAPAASRRDHRMSDLQNYRRDLAVLDSGSRAPGGQQTHPTTSTSQIAPWMDNASSPNIIGGDGPSTAPTASGSDPIHTTFFNDSSDNISSASQLSPTYRSSASRAGPTSGSQDSPDPAYYDERRPSLASITTLSSQGSKTSGNRGGLRKLQGFFGEEFPGRDSFDTNFPPQVPAKDGRGRSYSHGRATYRDRNYSNATDHARDASPSSSRPRTPVPAPEVVPFLYQEADDIARYGEAPVRTSLTGPDRERYMTDGLGQIPPKTASSSRSGHSVVHIHGQHRHNKSNDDPRSLRPSVSKEDASLHGIRDRVGSTATPYHARSRAQSPTPPGHYSSRNGPSDGPTSPGHHPKRGLLNRLRRHKEKDESPARLRELPPSSRSLATKPSRSDLSRPDLAGNLPPNWSGIPGGELYDFYDPRGPRAATFNNKFPFAKKGRPARMYDYQEESIGPTDRNEGTGTGTGTGTVYFLDTNLGDMDGILSKAPPLGPMDPGFLAKSDMEQKKVKQQAAAAAAAEEAAAAAAAAAAAPATGKQAGSGPGGSWYAPDSWGVQHHQQDNSYHLPDVDDVGSPPRPEEKLTPYCIRIFRSDGTFATLQMPLDSSVNDVISQLIKKMFVSDVHDNFQIILKKHDLIRVLNNRERPLLMQKRLLQQVGYEDRDRIEDVGREDNGYLCRFIFLSAREADFRHGSNDAGIGRLQKLNHVDLSGRNLEMIPISLYSKASDITSLNLSRNLSIDVPRDFIQSCLSLRDIKFNNNDARKLPPSFASAARLTYLDVSNNRLEQLEHARLQDITGLLKLNLANNHLVRLPSSFSAFKALRTINISSNFLDQFPPFLCGLEGLVDLDLSFNSISSIPDEIGQLQNLERLLITNNRLSNSVPSTFSQMSSLRELDIKYNGISNIDVISELPKLEILSVDHNNVSRFIGTFERLRSLRLNSNPVTKFELNQPVLTLKMLNLSNAQLASIDESFNNMLNLERLILDKNYFVSLPPQIGNLSRLEHFSIAHNTVGALPPQIGCLTELKVLDVRGNNIRKLPMEIWWANKLETLNASSNVLDNFPRPASRMPRIPGEEGLGPATPGSKHNTPGLSTKPSNEDLSLDPARRPSQASSTLLSVGPSPVPGDADRKGSMVSIYGKGGRKTSVVSRSTSQGTLTTLTPSSRKDSGLSARLANTFAGSLRNLHLADNQLDDDVFDQITLLSELRVLNLSYNEISDMPQRSIKGWPQLIELYLSGNELTTLPADDLEEYSLLQVLHINGNKFTNLPADISRAKKLAVLDCGSNQLKYNISNVPYDWNWNLNPNLRYLNLSGNKRLEIKQTVYGPSAAPREQYTDFNRLTNLRVLGLMDVTLTQPSIPDQSEDRRVRTSGSLAGHLPYGMADTLGKNEHLSTVDLVVPRFNASDTEMLLGLFDGQALSSGGSKIAKYLHENFGHIFSLELKQLKSRLNETPLDALRRAFLSLNKDLASIAVQHTDKRPHTAHRGSAQPLVLSKEDLNSGGVATVAYLEGTELYVANVGDAQAMLITEGAHRILTRKHEPAEPNERQRIREAGGWVSRNGRLNDMLEVSRAFGYVDLMPAVQAAPYVSHVSIKEQDDILLMATRELWEYLAPGLVVDVARSERGDLMRAAQKLRDLAISYGATGKIMVMMISVADLKRRVERSRLHRGQSMSWYPSGVPDEALAPRRGKRSKGDVLSSTLQRLEAEIPAPTGTLSIVFTDIKNSTNLWEVYPAAMRSAIKLHNDVMRRQLRLIGGYEVKTEGDAFMVSFPTATSALLWCFAVQVQLLEVNWPSEVLESLIGQPIYDKDKALIFRGLSVRMGIHYGDCVSETDPVTRRMDYFGPMVNKASRISAVADGGQITVSSDFISEIQRCLETYQDTDRTGSVGSDEAFDDESFASTIRKDLRSLTSQGFEVKEMGEKKLKGLENPEVVYSLYPHALAGRIDYHTQQERRDANFQPATLVTTPGSDLSFDTNTIWSLWRISLRLDMLCSTLECSSGELRPPETQLMEKMKQRGGEVTEDFMIHFLEHQVSRVETCISTLALRHLSIGRGPIKTLSDLRAPMESVIKSVADQLDELRRYKEKYGPLEPQVEEL